LLPFLSESSVTRLSVCMVAVLSSVRMFSVYSSALSIANCSACLLVHLLSKVAVSIPCPMLCRAEPFACYR
jgi:hypothetical protein